MTPRHQPRISRPITQAAVLSQTHRSPEPTGGQAAGTGCPLVEEEEEADQVPGPQPYPRTGSLGNGLQDRGVGLRAAESPPRANSSPLRSPLVFLPAFLPVPLRLPGTGWTPGSTDARAPSCLSFPGKGLSGDHPGDPKAGVQWNRQTPPPERLSQAVRGPWRALGLIHFIHWQLRTPGLRWLPSPDPCSPLKTPAYVHA